MSRLKAILCGVGVAGCLMTSPEPVGAQGAANASGEVRIGTQILSVRNLDVSHFRNGDPIPEAKTDEEWETAFSNLEPAWCYYENDALFGTHSGKSAEDSRARGKLYNWFAVTDPRGLAPEGWHVPSFEEWETLTVFLGGAGGVAEKAMMVVMDQPAPTTSQRAVRGAPPADEKSEAVTSQRGGNNSSGFTGLPGGIRDFEGRFTGYGAYAYWWSTTKLDTGLPSFLAWYRMLSFFPSPSTPGDPFTSPTASLGDGLSVRVVRN